jgi:nitrogen fixation/metabolism regulation signal transduction histidine kinase
MIGLIMIGIMVSFYLFFMLFLWKRAISMSDEIATPVAILSAAASELGSEEHRDAIPLCGVLEIDALTENFNIMSLQLDKRTQALVESEVLVKVQEKDAEIAFAQGKFESASGYLHNVGNSITRLGSVLFDLNELVKSTEQYPAIFEKIANGSDHELFIRFRSVLLEKSTPKLKESVLEIQRIKENIQQTIRHQQQTVKDAREIMIPVTFDLAELVRDVVSKTIPQDESFCVTQQIPEKLKILYHRSQMQNGIINIVKNAVEACQHSVVKEISISLEKTGEGIRLTVADNGSGIALEDRSRVMSAGFTTKPNGNGLGLHSFAIFLSANNGDLSLESDGPGQGAKASMEVVNV